MSAFDTWRVGRLPPGKSALSSTSGLGGFHDKGAQANPARRVRSGDSRGWTVLKPRQGVCVKRNIMFWRTNIEATKLRDNLYMLRVYGTDLINANTVALIGDEGVLLVDPGHPEMLRKQRAARPPLRDSRVRFVIDSHAHPDHACANGELFHGGAVIVGHSSIRIFRDVRRGPAAPAGRRPADDLRR